MDEAWPMRRGTPMSTATASLTRWRSLSSSSNRPFADSETLEPEDFADVFGGPPRSIFWRKMPGDCAAVGGNSFYQEIFRPTEIGNYGEYAGRGLPAFKIPGTSERFYSKVFGSDSIGEDRRSRDRSRANSKAKSKSTSSSVLSSEEMSPLRPAIGENVAFSDFASKLRPINIPSRRNSSTSKNASGDISMPSFCTNSAFMETESHWHFGRSHFGFSRRVSSPETMSLEPDSYPSVKISVEDAELNSPSSAVSSVCHDSTVGVPAKSENRDRMVEDDSVDDEEEEDDEIMSSYVIEIGSGSGLDHREGTCDAIGIDEAIAWAREKSQTHSAHEKDLNTRQEDSKYQTSKIDEGRTDAESGIVQASPKMEMRIQDENIRLWSVGKEADIRLLLSTLHYILWDNSVWSAIPLTNLIESSQVKKAYQKARLCLHPDKLQQRGATLPQKYVADKAFSILQKAWATFISQDVSFTG